MSVDANRLLFVISAHGSMTWPQYCEAVDFLSTASVGFRGMADSATTRSGLLQCLAALGHCDTHYENGESTINVSPPALCRLPRTGLPIAVLTGARCMKTQDQIAAAVKARGGTVRLNVKRDPGPLYVLPDTIIVESESETTMADFCSDLQINYVAIPPAWTLVNWCGMLFEYEAILDYRISDTLNWVRYDFDASLLSFVRKTSDMFPRFTRYRNPTTGLPLHVFFRNGLGAEVDLNWGRYLLLNSKGLNVAAYDEKRFRLCIPVTTPLPALIARSLCLCSGKPPVHRYNESLIQARDCQNWLMFEDVPPHVALAAMSKVGQTPVRVSIR